MKSFWTGLFLFFFGMGRVFAGDYDVFINPVSSGISTGCDFGDSPCASDDDYHAGIDYTSSDRNVVAVNHGRVVQIVKNGEGDHGLGNTVILEHWLVNGGKVYSCYSHLESIDALVYEKRSMSGTDEEWMSLGDPIGKMGGSGFGNPSYWSIHLHLEFKTQGVLGSPNGNYYGYTPDYPTGFGYLNFHNYLGKVYVEDPYLSGDGSGYSGDSGDPGHYSGGQGGGTSPSPSNTKPDFYVVSVKIADDRDGDHPREAYYPNEKFYVIVTIGNAGIEPTKDVVVGCYLYEEDGDREKVGEEDIKHEHLPKGGTHTERFELEDIDPGTYPVKVRPDNEKEISESNEDNNWSTPVTLVIREWPNFTVEGIVFDEGTVFTPGAVVSMRGKFLNRGGDTKDGIAVACYLVSGGTETLVATQTIKDYHLEENEYHWEGMIFTLPAVPGNYSLKVVADYNRLVRESNENDNSMTVPLTVVAPIITTTTSATTTSTTTSTTTTSTTTTMVATTIVAPTTTTTSTTTVATTTTIAGTTTSSTTLPPAIILEEYFEEGLGNFVLEDGTLSHNSLLEWRDGMMVIINNNPPSDASSVRVKVGGLDFRGSAQCRLSFSLNSTAVGSNFDIVFFNSASDDALFYEVMKILPGQGKCAWTFTVNGQGVDLSNIQMAFGVGEKPGEYCFNNIVLERTKAVDVSVPNDEPIPAPDPAPAPAPAPAPNSQPAVQNVQNEDGDEGGGGEGCFATVLSN